MVVKFTGKPNFIVRSKTTGVEVFRFSRKGVYITDDTEVIERATGHFDHVIIIEEEKPSHKCKYCSEEFDTKGALLAHYKKCNKK